MGRKKSAIKKKHRRMMQARRDNEAKIKAKLFVAGTGNIQPVHSVTD